MEIPHVKAFGLEGSQKVRRPNPEPEDVPEGIALAHDALAGRGNPCQTLQRGTTRRPAITENAHADGQRGSHPGTRGRPGSLAAHLEILRPKQWIKSGFLLPAPLFGHALGSAESFVRLGAAVLGFSLLSSAVYIANDILDAEADRHHPAKRLRPVSSGRVRPAGAALLAGALLLAAMGIAAAVSTELLWIACLYVLNNILYFAFLKRRTVADVLSIAVGFMLRILAGAAAVGVEPSYWLMICGFSLALFLGFCKRRSECGRHADPAVAAVARHVLSRYTEEKLNILMGSTATLSILTYMLFTVSPDTVARHGTGALIYSSPFVVYGVYRYLLKAIELEGEDATEVLLKDPAFLVAGLGWAAAVTWTLYAP